MNLLATLERVQQNLKRYRASVLKAAVEGRLVPTEAELAHARRVEAASRRFLELHARRVEAASRRFLELSSTSEIPEVPIATRRDAASTSPSFFDREQGVIVRAGNLPHWQQPGSTYFITFRLADSLPKAVSERIREERQRWLRSNPEPHTRQQRAQYYRLFSKKLDEKLDAGLGSCVLKHGKARNILRDALYHFDGERYFLHDWVIMPNHVHVLLTLQKAHDLSKVLQSIKSFSAKKINRLFNRSGKLWQKESFDHIVRSAESFERLRGYVAGNPRGIQDGEFSLGQEIVGWDDVSLTRRDAASTFEPASVLLDRILAERRRRWEEAELTKTKAKGSEATSAKKPQTRTRRKARSTKP